MAVVLSVLPIYRWIVTIDPHRAVVVGDGEGEDLSVDLALATDKAEELDYGPDRESHAVGVLAVRNVKGLDATFYLVRQEGKEHIVGGHEVGLVAGNPIAKNRGNLVQLVLCESFPSESYRVVGLWASPGQRD